MCGIAGYYGTTSLDEGRIATCVDRMKRRGPDCQFTEHLVTPQGRHVHLLHSRLSILDLDPRSNQPFHDGGDVLSFNGEIYNFVELAENLARSGEALSTSGDTGVLARMLTLRGADCLTELEGMFALSWLSENGELLLARDRFGEKPLYVYRPDAETIYFGSEPKFIFALLGQSLPINERHLVRYLINGYKSLYKTRDTFFLGLEEVSPGSVMTIGPGHQHETSYWSPSFAGQQEDMSYEEAVVGARECLIRSMELRLRADVPVAFCLSGGIDSNALISIARRELGYDVHGFTIVNTDARYEELDMVNLSVSELGIRNTQVPIETTGFIDGLRELIRYHDAPVYTITYFAHWRLMEAIAKQGYRVSVSGTAADELFSGYFDHHLAYLAAIKHDYPQREAEARQEWAEYVKPLVRNPFLQDPDYLVRNPLSREHIYLDADVFAGNLVRPFFEPFSETFRSNDLLRNRMANELTAESVPVILHEDDLNSMYYSIENRSPFLDTPLFDWCQSIPTRHLIRNGRAKSVLRDAVRGLAADPILDNPRKVGFNAPLLDYLDLSDGETRSAILEDGPVYDIVDRTRIAEMCDLDQLANSQSKFLFNFINAKFFLEEFAA